MKNIVLIGMPGSGKTTIGKRLAKELGRPFYDADRCLEQWEERTIAELFAAGEAVFRDAETRTVRRLAAVRGAVIAAGGGVVCRRENIEILKETSLIIYIDRAVEDILKDIRTEKRPLLADGAERLYALYEERHEKYTAGGDWRVANTGTLSEITARIAGEIRRKQHENMGAERAEY